MKMIHTSYGYMTPMEAKIIGDIDREEKEKYKRTKEGEMNNENNNISK